MLRLPPRSPLFPYTTLFRSVDRPAVHRVVQLEAVLRDLCRVDVVHKQPTAAGCGWRGGLIPHLTVARDHDAVGLYALAVLEQEVLAAGVRSRHRHVKRRVRGGPRAGAVGPRAREWYDRHPTQLTERPRIQARRAEPGEVRPVSHEAVPPDPRGE